MSTTDTTPDRRITPEQHADVDLSQTETETETVEIPVEEYEELVALREENEELRDEVAEYRKENERDKADIRSDLYDLKEAVKPAIGLAEREKMDADPQGDTEEPTGQTRESGIEQVCGLPDEMARKQLTKNGQRARYVALRIMSLGRSTNQGGYYIMSEKLKRILDDYDKSGHTQTVSRVMDFLKDFGRSSEIKTKINEEGKRLVWFRDDLAERLSEIAPELSDESITNVVIGSRG
jgi:predicted phage gp36 major capsid-like protein